MNDDERQGRAARQAADEWTARWLDDRDDSPASDEGTSHAAADVDMRRVADLRLLHVLLEQMHQPSTEETNRRLRRLFSAIDGQRDARPSDDALHESRAVIPLSSSPRRAPRRLLVSSLTAAAVLAGLLMTWLLWDGRQNMAHAAVRTMLEEATVPRDRQFRVLTEFRVSASQSLPIKASLFVRGGEKFALRHPGLMGDFWIGSNGRQGWFVPAIGQTVIHDDFGRTLAWAQQEGVALPDLQLTSLLARFADQYEVELLDDAPLEIGDATLCTHVRGRLRVNDSRAPVAVELWADRASGVARRVILEWNLGQAARGLSRITLDLDGNQPLADEWYEPHVHVTDNSGTPTSIPAPPQAEPALK